MTRIERTFAGTVKETISESASFSKPNSTAAPVRRGEPPTDLDARGEVSRELRPKQSDVTYERRLARYLDGPEAEAGLGEVRARAFDQGVAGRSVEHGGHELHDLRVGVQGGERPAVGFAPRA
jgi:hypothetical protein